MPGGPQPVVTAQKETSPRAVFARNMGKVTEGMPAADVEKLLGKPDDIRTDTDPGGIDWAGTTEIWRYGTDGHLTFPTLGSVFMSDGKVQYVFGGSGTPPAAGMFDEAELRRLLRAIDAINENNPLSLIQAANALQPLGKTKGMAAIAEYLRVRADDISVHFADINVFLLLRLLFEVPKDTGVMPAMLIGASGGYPQPDGPNAKLLPLYPLVLVDDIPLNLSTGYTLGGVAQPVREHFDFFAANGVWKGRPLVPSNDPLGALDKLVNSPAWADKDKQPRDSIGAEKHFLAEELLVLIDNAYRIKPDDRGQRLPGEFSQEKWDRITKVVAALHIHWDATKAIYVLADGTSLPDVKHAFYKRCILDVP
ncbi:MAG TPA: hypothetical protein VG733_12440, partial [Chthoniobacteraceae bacterium]|nr:hypothetical protein [Chthoniobacteraceae bacterium]